MVISTKLFFMLFWYEVLQIIQTPIVINFTFTMSNNFGSLICSLATAASTARFKCSSVQPIGSVVQIFTSSTLPLQIV